MALTEQGRLVNSNLTEEGRYAGATVTEHGREVEGSSGAHTVSASDTEASYSETAARASQSFGRSATDAEASYSETATAFKTVLVAAADTLDALSEAASRLLSLVRNPAESLASLAEAATRVVASVDRTATDTEDAYSESADAHKLVSVSASESLDSWTESASRALQSFARSSSDTEANYSESAKAPHAATVSAADTISTYTESAAASKGRRIARDVDWTDNSGVGSTVSSASFNPVAKSTGLAIVALNAGAASSPTWSSISSGWTRKSTFAGLFGDGSEAVTLTVFVTTAVGGLAAGAQSFSATHDRGSSTAWSICLCSLIYTYDDSSASLFDQGPFNGDHWSQSVGDNRTLTPNLRNTIINGAQANDDYELFVAGLTTGNPAWNTIASPATTFSFGPDSPGIDYHTHANTGQGGAMLILADSLDLGTNFTVGKVNVSAAASVSGQVVFFQLRTGAPYNPALATISDSLASLSETATREVQQPRYAAQFASSQLVSNGDFETGSLSGWTTGTTGTNPFTPVIETATVHSGSDAVQVGADPNIANENNGDSFVYQDIAIPGTVTSAALSFWYWPATQDHIAFDWQNADILNTSNTVLQNIFHISSNTQTWTQVTRDVSAYIGQTIRLRFLAHGDGAGDYTWMFVDDVSLTTTTITRGETDDPYTELAHADMGNAGGTNFVRSASDTIQAYTESATRSTVHRVVSASDSLTHYAESITGGGSGGGGGGGGGGGEVLSAFEIALRLTRVG
jgi:hypothetical protein